MYKLVNEYSENIHENETLDIIPLNEIPLNVIPLNVYKKGCNFCMVYMVLFVVFLIKRKCIYCVSIYFYCYLKKDNISTNFSVGYGNT